MLVKLRSRTQARPGRKLLRAMRGFTLIELVVTIAVIAVLAGMAAPSFTQFIAAQRIRNASFDLMAALTLVRSEAITRNTNVALLRTQSAWDGGWKVTADNGATALLNQQSYSGLSITDSAGLSQVVYSKDGRTSSASTKFTIAPATAMTGVSPKCVLIGPSGVPRSSTGGC